MKTIQLEQILKLYNACGLSGKESNAVRYEINTGFLNNSLNRGVNAGVLPNYGIPANAFSNESFCVKK